MNFQILTEKLFHFLYYLHPGIVSIFLLIQNLNSMPTSPPKPIPEPDANNGEWSLHDICRAAFLTKINLKIRSSLKLLNWFIA